MLTVKRVMRGTLATLVLVSSLLVLALNAWHAAAGGVQVLCPEVLPVAYTPYNYTLHPSLVQGASILDALPVDKGHVLVALSNSYLLLLPAPRGLAQREIQNPVPRDMAYTRLVVDRLEPVRPGFAAGYGGLAKDTVLFGIGLCGRECINAWMLSAFDSKIILAYMPQLYTPTGKPLKRLLVLTASGTLYVLDPLHPNLILGVRQTLPSNLTGGSVERAEPLVSCNGMFYGIVEDVLSGGSHVLVVYNYYENHSWIVARGYQLLDARYYPGLSLLVIAGLDQQERLVLILAPGYNPSLSTVRELNVTSVGRALIVPGSNPIRIVAYLTAPQPRLQLIEYNATKRKILWSIPLPGQLNLLSFTSGSCNPDYVLAAVTDGQGRLTLHLVRLSDGRHLWILLVGVSADNAVALHYAYGWFTAATTDTIHMVNVEKLLTPLYAVPLAVRVIYPNGTSAYVPFTANITCVAGACRDVFEGQTLIVRNTVEGPTTIALPPGVYRVDIVSKYAGRASEYFKVLNRGECRIAALDDPPGLTINISFTRVRICVWSAGDPQGWGFDRGPVANATVRVASDFGLYETVSTGSDGCASLDLPPGVYNVSVYAEGYRPASTTLKVNTTPVTYKIVVKPYCARVKVEVYAYDTRRPLRNATAYVSEGPTVVAVKPFMPFYLPPGNYTVRASAPHYLDASQRLTIPRRIRGPTVETVKLALKPRLYNTLIVLVLEKPLHRNATAYIMLTRSADGVTLTFTVHKMIPAKAKTVRVLLKLPWGTYRAKLIVPLHQPTTISFTVPSAKAITVKLRVVQYKLLVRTIDIASGRPVRVKVVAVTAGYRTTFYSGTPVTLPLGNYTLTVEERFYRRIVKKIILNHDMVVTLNLAPVTFPVEVRVYLQRKPLRNVTVSVVGTAFDGVKVNKTVRTGKDGSAIVQLLPGNYTFTAYYPVHSMFATVTFTAVKKVAVTGTTTVRLIIRPSPILYILHFLPYILLTLIILIISAIFFALRRTIKERFRRLREALAERFGGAPEEFGEEGLEELF